MRLFYLFSTKLIRWYLSFEFLPQCFILLFPFLISFIQALVPLKKTFFLKKFRFEKVPLNMRNIKIFVVVLRMTELRPLGLLIDMSNDDLIYKVLKL